MTTTQYDEIADHFRGIALLLESSISLTGTQTLEGLSMAAYYLDMAKKSMAELEQRINDFIKDA